MSAIYTNVPTIIMTSSTSPSRPKTASGRRSRGLNRYTTTNNKMKRR